MAVTGDTTRESGRRSTRSTDRLVRALSVIGRGLIIGGVVVLLFVAYQLWGTGLREAASQRELRAEFEQQLAEDAATDDTRGRASGRDREADQPHRRRTAPQGDGTAPAASQAPAPPVAIGNPVGVLKIPKLGLDKVVVEGTDVASLRKGPGHQPGTAALGHPGNAVIAGHRTTYGAPFYDLNELEPGDPISVQLPEREVRYTVTGSQIVEPTDVWILDPTPDDRLTLFTCNPRYSAAERLVVTASLEGPSPPAPLPGTATAVPSTPPPLAVGQDELAAATGSLLDALLWAAGTTLIAIALWLLGRRFRRLVVYPLGAPLVAVALFFTFERVAELLPSAV